MDYTQEGMTAPRSSGCLTFLKSTEVSEWEEEKIRVWKSRQWPFLTNRTAIDHAVNFLWYSSVLLGAALRPLYDQLDWLRTAGQPPERFITLDISHIPRKGIDAAAFL